MLKNNYKINLKDPLSVANRILNALRNDDIDSIISLFNEANRRKFKDITDEKRNQLRKHVEKHKSIIIDVEKVNEIKKAPSFMGEGSVVIKLKEVGREVFVIALTKEGDNYYFDDINSPSVKKYEQLVPI